MQVAAIKLPYPLETTEVAIEELLAQYEEVAVAEMLVDQKEWQVHVLQVTMSVFGLTVYATSLSISAHLRNFCAGSTI
jgi:hypothetical protein